MSDKAIEVIAGFLADVDQDPTEWWLTLAKGILTALKTAQIAVVELPEPSSQTYDESDVALFTSESGSPIRVRWCKQVIYGSDWLTPSEARSDAAALLAAADAAEAVQ